MKTIAIFGGTRFFGKNLVHKLKQQNHIVDVYSKNHADYEIDRNSFSDIELNFTKCYDVVIDNLCFGSSDAKIINDFFEENPQLLPKQYIFTSSSFIYKNANIAEQAYNESYTLHFENLTNKKYPEIDYSLGKKEAEFVLQNGILSNRVTVIRPPFMLGLGDHTNRLFQMIHNVKTSHTINITAYDLHPMSFVDIDFLSDVIQEFITLHILGIYNITNNGCINNKELYQLIAAVLSREIDFKMIDSKEKLHPYTEEQSLCLEIKRLQQVYKKEIPNTKDAFTSIIRGYIEKT